MITALWPGVVDSITGEPLNRTVVVRRYARSWRWGWRKRLIFEKYGNIAAACVRPGQYVIAGTMLGHPRPQPSKGVRYEGK